MFSLPKMSMSQLGKSQTADTPSPPEQDNDATAPTVFPGSIVPRWAVHRRLYDWVLSLAHRQHSTTALFLLSFAESSFFPIPPDVLQIALTLERRGRAWFYALISTLGSVLGGVAGYLIGWGLWELVSGFFFRYIFSQDVFEHVQHLYQKYDFWCVFVAAFTPIPYKVFTVGAGVFQISLFMLIIASCVGRGARFFLVAGLLYIFGPPVRQFIDKYFNWVCLVFAVLLVGGFALVKLAAQ
ncbi:MAG: YqaA family protein [Gemmataceae bacterium]